MRRRIQARLAAEGLDPEPADGVFGFRTREAIRSWQKGAGNLVTGYLTGPEAERLAGAYVPPVAKPAAGPVEDGSAGEEERLATAAMGRLAVKTNVAGAVVRVDGREQRLPGPDLELPAGTHAVEVSAEGYAPFAERVDVLPGERASLDVGLEREVRWRRRAAFSTPGNTRRRLIRRRHWCKSKPMPARRICCSGARCTRSIASRTASHRCNGRSPWASEWSLRPDRHGVGNFRQDFCRGVLAFDGGEVTFRSEEDDSHDFFVAADRITDVEVVASIDGQPFWLASRVQDRGSQRRLVEFVHRNVVRQSGSSRYSAVLVCSDCDGSLGVQAALMRAGG